MKSFKGIFFALISSGTFGLIPLFSIPLMNEDHMETSSILFYRFLFSAIMMGIICLFKKESFRVPSRTLLTIIGLGVLYAVTALCLIYSYHYIPSGVATTIHFLYPICVSFLMVAFFKERKSAALICAAILSLIGVALLCWSGNGGLNLKGVAIVSITIFTYASYIVGINQTEAGKLNSEVLTFYILLCGAFLFFFFDAFSSGLQPIPSFSAAGKLIGLAFLATVISDLTLILAIKYAGSTITSILGSMEPLVAVLIGVLYFHESFGLNSFLGVTLIILSVALVILFGQKKSTSKMK